MSAAFRARLSRLEGRHHGQGVASVTYHAGEWRHQGAVISEDALHRLGRTHAHLVIRGDPPPMAGCITIQRSYGQT